MVQIPKTWNLNPSTNICPSCGNIHSIKIMIYKKLMGEETFKTFNFRPNFCIKSHILAHNSQEGPCSYLKSHTPEKLLPIRFWWCITLAWDTKFLLSGFLASVHGGRHGELPYVLPLAVHLALQIWNLAAMAMPFQQGFYMNYVLPLRFMMFSLNMVDCSLSFLLLSTWNLFWQTTGGTNS